MMAKEIAVECGIKQTSFIADLVAYGLRAGPIRNQEMVDSKPALVVAFPGNDGTADAVRRAKEAGIEVLEIE